ncbi:MAG: hypothetical protein GF400_02015 [Candidatus Eisenbacteria bacterium]|nr:hypothetical protein [Candidatus Eisenbacteria bacterium]
MTVVSRSDPYSTTLDCGLRVVCARRPGAPVVAVVMLYGAGSVRDPSGLSGLAHLTEHMMFRGTTRFADGAIDELTNRLGGANNAMTTNDYTAYYFVFPVESWTVGVEIEIDRMSNCLLDAVAFETERSIAVEERQMLDDEPEAILEEALEKAAYGSHPYGLPIVGLMEDLERATRDDLRRFYETWYAPSNAVLSVAGDVQPDRVLELAGSACASAAPASSRSMPDVSGKAPGRAAPTNVRLSRDSGIARLLVGFRCPEALHEDSPAMELVAAVLGSGRSSRLYRRLVAGTPDVNDVSVDRMLQLYPGLFTVSADLSVGGDLSACEDAIMGELVELAAAGPSVEEVAKAKRLWLMERSLGLESALGLAGHLAFWKFVGGLPAGDEHARRVLAATPDDVARVTGVYLSPESRNSVWMTPETP